MMWREQFLLRPRPTVFDRLLRRTPRERPAKFMEIRVRAVGDSRWVLPVITDAHGWAEVALPPGRYEASGPGWDPVNFLVEP
jgi:hypothetical protein